MTILLDTSVMYAHHDRHAPRHDVASAAMARILAGAFGQPITTDYLYDEAVTLIHSRTADVEAARRLGERIRGVGEFPDAIDLQFVGEAGFHRAVELHEQFDDQGLSFTDATIVAHVEIRGIDAVLTLDDDFDGIVERLDPRDL